MKRFAAVAVVLTLALPAVAVAHDHHEAGKSAPAARTVHDDYLAVFNAGEQKIKALAGAFSDEQYAWRPAEGVRSVGEAFQHIAAATYLLGGMLGIAAPEGMPSTPADFEEFEKASSKAEVAASLEKAFAHAHHIIGSVTPEQLAQEVDFFGNTINGRTLVLILADHNAEHLGQLIAYARSNGVVPPWSVPAESEGTN